MRIGENSAPLSQTSAPSNAGTEWLGAMRIDFNLILREAVVAHRNQRCEEQCQDGSNI